MSLYAAVFSIWMTEIVHMIRENPRGLRQAHIKIMDLGRFDGWRINVNRPTKKSYLAPEFEIYSQRSQDVYRTYKDLVLKAARGEVALYFDVHHYGGQRIQVATIHNGWNRPKRSKKVIKKFAIKS
jgi:hypothetical protein